MAEGAETQGAEESAPPRRKGLGTRGKIILGVLALTALVALAIWLIHYETRGKYVEGTNDAYLQADAVTVSPRISGYVEQVFVRDNQDVKAGQPLVKVDPRDYGAQAAQYRAQVDVAQAGTANAEAALREQAAAIDQARAQLASANANARFTASEVARYRPLAASGAETREKLASLQTQATQAASEAANRAAALTQAEQRRASLRAQIRQSQAQGEAARAQLVAANVNLNSTLIRASVDGRIGSKTVRVGQYVTLGTRLMSVVPLSTLYVAANFKETQLGRMRPGQPATITADVLPGVQIPGHVESISPGTGAEFSLLPPQNATGNFTKIVQRVPVRIAVDASPDVRKVLVAGLSVDVEVDTIDARKSLERIKEQQNRRNESRR